MAGTSPCILSKSIFIGFYQVQFTTETTSMTRRDGSSRSFFRRDLRDPNCSSVSLAENTTNKKPAELYASAGLKLVLLANSAAHSRRRAMRVLAVMMVVSQ